MKKGTPAGTQLDCGVKALFFPASTSSMSFFMCSFTQGFKFGLERSAIRKVGCLATPLGVNGYAGSLTTGGPERARRTDHRHSVRPTRLDSLKSPAVLASAVPPPEQSIPPTRGLR